MDLEQLLVCRLVCKTWCWNTNLKTLIRANSVVNLRAVFLHTSATASNLQEYFQKSGTIYSYYNFEDISFQNVFISNFFQVIGPTITSLKLLLNLQQLNRRQFRELIYERVPNLKELNIYNLSHKEIYSKPLAKSKDVGVGAPYNLRHDNLAKLQLQETRTLIIPFMTEFLRTLPKLKEISLKVGICRDWVEQADLWRENSSIATSVIKALEVSKAFQTLKVFRCGKLRRIHIECLLGMASGENGLRLEVLQVHVPHKDSEDIFTTFLNTQRNCLIELSLFEQRSSRHKRKPTGTTGQPQYFVLKFPNIMTKLEVLQLSKHYKSVIVPLAPIDFSIQCPKLKKLVLLGQYADANSHLRINETNTSVCDIVMWNRVIHASSALELGSFINLKKLHIRYPTSEFLANLWQSCDKIQNLTLILEEGTYVDEGIAGIPETVIAEWVSQAMETGSPLLEIVTKNFKEEDKCVDNASDNNSITNLKGIIRCIFIVFPNRIQI